MQTTKESIVVDLFHWSIAVSVSVPCEASIVPNDLGQCMSEYHLQPGAMECYKVLQGATNRSYIGVMPSEVFHIQYLTYGVHCEGCI
jgi:hypothetical protein